MPERRAKHRIIIGDGDKRREVMPGELFQADNETIRHLESKGAVEPSRQRDREAREMERAGASPLEERNIATRDAPKSDAANGGAAGRNGSPNTTRQQPPAREDDL